MFVYMFFGLPQGNVYVPQFLGNDDKRDPHKLFRGDFWGQKAGPKQAIFGCKKFYCSFLPLKSRR